MKEKSYTIEQIEFVNYVSQKVKDLFLTYTDPAHGVDHIERVVNWAKEIAFGEHARSIFLCELSAWLHDIGRTREDKPGENSRKHHELSYIILKEWFEEDEKFNFLSTDEKIELLYAVKYHWNNMADDYDTAWILRDADKLDGYGEVGMKRARQLSVGDEEWNWHLRHVYETSIHIHTKTAKKIIKEKNMMDPVHKASEKYLKSQIEPIEL
jgi:HD superfamily phosphodiesterase